MQATMPSSAGMLPVNSCGKRLMLRSATIPQTIPAIGKTANQTENRNRIDSTASATEKIAAWLTARYAPNSSNSE